ncbi:hypothetical protein BOX15_Mlig012029g2 [Macrostomum lignano]|uniref:CNNM transmembrane domain-containing protein n=2 Tax=Macrostomum lignano TaxID=282301 RepID=A0A1I8IME2_9PLAT|nr:hypothetical protein BOX15_Mlig012029g2 [Macrostomum lignano]
MGIPLNCTLTAPNELWCNGTEYHEANHILTPEDTWFWIYLGIYTGLVIGAGLMSGLTIGLLSLDPLSLKVLADSGNGSVKKYAKRLLPIIKRHHWLLVTLLLGNAACVEAMPIFLDRVSDPIIAIVVSVTAVLFFGEVIPQALCTKFGLAIGYYCLPLVYLFMALLCPIAFPLSKLLDLLLGANHETVFKKEELKALVGFHGPRVRREGDYLVESGQDPQQAVASQAAVTASSRNIIEDGVAAAQRSVLTFDEVAIIKGALELSSVPAEDACTPIDEVFMLSDSSALTDSVRLKIIANAHSRVPIFHGDNRNDIRGHLLTKMLLIYANKAEVSFARIIADKKCFREMPYVPCQTPLYDLLNVFQQGKSHMAVVFSTETGQVRGIITLENVLERLLMEPIRDEADEIREEIGRNLRARAGTRTGVFTRQMSAAAVGSAGALVRQMASALSAGALAGYVNAPYADRRASEDTRNLISSDESPGAVQRGVTNRSRTFEGGDDTDSLANPASDIQGGFVQSEVVGHVATG